MDIQQCQLNYIHKTATLGSENHIDIVQNLQYVQIDAQLIDLYVDCQQYQYLICPQHVNRVQKSSGMLVVRWGKQFSTLSSAYIQAYCKQSWVRIIIKAYVQLAQKIPQISTANVYMGSQGGLKILITKCCKDKQQYIEQFKALISTAFKHLPNVEGRSKNVKNINDIQEWMGQFQEKKEGHSIAKMIQFKNSMPKVQKTYRIEIKEDQKEWILKTIGHQASAKMTLVYDGQKNMFDPEKLMQVANKQQLLFFLQTSKGKRAAFWMAAKPEINQNNLFGTYYEDKSKKSVLLNIQKRSIHKIGDQAASVGFGKQVLLSIGRFDLIFSAFNCSNISYFPCSYEVDEEKGVKTIQDFLGRQFSLRQLQAYRIN